MRQYKKGAKAKTKAPKKGVKGKVPKKNKK